MIEQKQPDALRLAEVIEDYVECTEFDSEQAAAELRRQHAEIEALQDDLAHKDDYAEQLGRELAKADSVIKELRAKLDELEKQEPVAVKNHNPHLHMVGPDDGGRVSIDELSAIPIGTKLYLAAGARPVEPAPADGWLHSSGMLYRLTDERRPKNRDEINVTMADGSRSLESRSRRAGELLDCIRAMQAAADKKEPTNGND